LKAAHVPRIDPFRIVDEMLVAFEGKSGFRPNTFVADSITSGRRSGRPKAGKVSRSFRYESEGCCALVRVPTARMEWSEHVAQGLTHAGYEKWLSFDDESVFRRWLKGHRERVAELELLKTMGEDGVVEALRGRKLVDHVEGEGRPRAWASAIHEARSAGIGWSECTVGFSLGERTQLLSGPKTVTLQVGALGGRGSTSGSWMTVYVSVFNKQDRRAPLPTILVRELRRQLHFECFEREKVRVAGEPRVLDGPIFSSKRVRSASNAADECSRMLALLVQRARAI
jgi:hypothetical protein